jgi:hypothetical protein
VLPLRARQINGRCSYGLARDAALLRERLPHARLDVLEAGQCVWEERATEFESIVTQWVNGGFEDSRARPV